MGNPNYYAVITAEVRYDKTLSASEKLFFAELTALTNMNGKCFASNNYFAELYGVDRSTVTSWVRKLAQKGFIDVEYEYDGKQITKRSINLVNTSGLHKFAPSGGGDSDNQVVIKEEGGGDLNNGGWLENTAYNNTLTESNITSTKSNTKGREIFSDDFELAWVAYERKGSKKIAYREWKRAGKEEWEKITSAIPKYKAGTEFRYRKDFERYISHGTYMGMSVKEAEDKKVWDGYKPLGGSTREILADYGSSVG
jgi:hypothetical protein